MAPGVAPATLTELAEGGRRLCQALHGLGYRGMVSAAVIINPDGELYFSEYNGRITGSTHIYQVLGEHIVGEDYARTRVLYEVDGWVVPSFRAAADRLAESGLAYSPATRTGAVLVMAYNPSDSTPSRCSTRSGPTPTPRTSPSPTATPHTATSAPGPS